MILHEIMFNIGKRCKTYNPIVPVEIQWRVLNEFGFLLSFGYCSCTSRESGLVFKAVPDINLISFW